MGDSVSFLEVLKQLTVVVPVMIVGIQTIAAAINGVLNIQSANVKHIITWVLGALIGAGFVAFNGLTFGLPVWANYTVGVVCGILAAAAANGFYDWPKLKAIFDAILDFFGNLVHGDKFYKNIAA